MEELWQQTSELLIRRPLLWLPVLMADLLGYLVSLGDRVLVRMDLAHHLQYQSALGGPAIQGQVNATAVEHLTLIALLLSWATFLLHILFYTAALAVTAKLVSTYMGQRRRDALPALPGATVGGVLGLAFQVWVVYVVLSFGFGWLTRSLVTHGHRTLLAGGWFELGGAALLFALLAFLLAPAVLQMLTQRRTLHLFNSQAQVFGFLLGMVALLLGHSVRMSIRSVHITDPASRYALEITGSWIAALPFVIMFTGFGLLAMRSLAATVEAQP